jgi:DNA-binding NarL/FixJ family response regulator
MLTIDTDDVGVLDAVHAGASGYLLKDAELAEIVSGIRAVAAGLSAVAPGVAGALLRSVRTNNAIRIDQARRTEPKPRASFTLSPREREVLALLTRGCDNGSIARQLFVSPSTVKHHVSRLLEKIGARNRVEAATFAVRTGLYDGLDPSA